MIGFDEMYNTDRFWSAFVQVMLGGGVLSEVVGIEGKGGFGGEVPGLRLGKVSWAASRSWDWKRDRFSGSCAHIEVILCPS